MLLTRIWPVVKDASNQWNADKAPRLGAALAYYTIFSRLLGERDSFRRPVSWVTAPWTSDLDWHRLAL